LGGGTSQGGSSSYGPAFGSEAISIQGFPQFQILNDLLTVCALAGETHEPGAPNDPAVEDLCNSLAALMGNSALGGAEIAWLLSYDLQRFGAVASWLANGSSALADETARAYIRFLQNGGEMAFKKFVSAYQKQKSQLVYISQKVPFLAPEQWNELEADMELTDLLYHLLQDAEDEEEEQPISNGIEIGWSYVTSQSVAPYNPQIGITPYRHPIGQNGELPEDLQSGTDGDVSILQAPDLVNASDARLIRYMRNLLWVGCVSSGGLYENTAKPFIYDEFLGNSASSTRIVDNTALSNAVMKSIAMQNYVKHIGAKLRHALSQNNGDFNNISIQLSDASIDRPRFSEKTTGLGILINDTEQTKIHILASSFDEDTGEFEAFLFFEILDHFGLDDGDVIEWGNSAFGLNFQAWWLLQHHRGYVPFRTRIMNVFQITGNIND
jgi:hypothetical protein